MSETDQTAEVVTEDVRTCETCDAAMAPDQDWCLTCGAAAPGRLGTRPGWRAAATVAALTLTLVTGAVAASYAALTDDATRQAGGPPPASATPVPGQQAQVPPSSAPPAAPPASDTPQVPEGSGAAPTPEVPKLPPTGAPATPPTATPPKSSPSPTPTPTRTQPERTADERDRDEDDAGDRTSDGDSSTRPELTPIALGADAAQLYDPYGRATDKGDPADVQDDRDDTSWFVTTPEDGKPMQVGLVVDLEANKLVRALTLATSTPGFRVEVYGADTSVLPPDILDTRWDHITSRSSVDETSRGTNAPGDGEERIVFPRDGDRYRYVLLWFTTKPDKGPTVKLGEVTLLG